MDAFIPAIEAITAVASRHPPLVIDVRREAAFRDAPEIAMGALRRDPEAVASWGRELPRAEGVVVYCVHGHEVSQNVTKALREQGIAARYLQGGLEEGWKSAGGRLMKKPRKSATRWVTRERPKIDRIACPWLIARFIDPGAEFLYVPAPAVREAADRHEAIAYDVPDVHFSHVGEECSFDAFLKTFHISDPALGRLATIVRGADTDRHHLAPQAAGLLAVSLGLSRLIADDQAMLKQGMVVYDALYAWCKEGQDERHTWNPAAYR